MAVLNLTVVSSSTHLLDTWYVSWSFWLANFLAINVAAIGAGTRPEQVLREKGCLSATPGHGSTLKAVMSPNLEGIWIALHTLCIILSCLVRSCYSWGILQLKEIRANECFFDQGRSIPHRSQLAVRFGGFPRPICSCKKHDARQQSKTSRQIFQNVSKKSLNGMFMSFLGRIPCKSTGCFIQVAIYNPFDILGKMVLSVYQGHEALFQSWYPPQLVGRCVGHGGTCDDWQGRGGVILGYLVCGTSPNRLASLWTILEYRHTFWRIWRRLGHVIPFELRVTTSVWSSRHSTLIQAEVISCAFRRVCMCMHFLTIVQ